MKQALLIFTRNPVLGKCKTRLAKTIGDKATLEIYLHLLHHTAKTTSPLIGVDKRVYFSERIGSLDIWNPDVFSHHVQYGSDLGIRMEQAFLETFALGYEKVVIIGSDLPDLSSSDIYEAFAGLNKHEVVLGPASDGGYYLLGLKKIIPSVFENKDWGTNTVLDATLKNLNKLSTFLLQEKNDIDRYEDLIKYTELLALLKNTTDDGITT